MHCSDHCKYFKRDCRYWTKDGKCKVNEFLLYVQKGEILDMILTDKNHTKIIIECDCGSESIGISKLEFDDGFFIDISINAFYSEQDSFFSKLKKRIKTAWYILRRGTYRLQEICLTEQDLKDLKEIIQNFQ